ncbi:twin-arginine translocase TatA/TatE family subunit [bacterium]|nr:twin-arginine translocase TatA/TatE family subunit [bacterium]
MFPSLSHLLIVLLLVLVLFGAGKLPKVMGDLGKGMRSFREGLHGDDVADAKKLDKPADKKDA